MKYLDSKKGLWFILLTMIPRYTLQCVFVYLVESRSGNTMENIYESQVWSIVKIDFWKFVRQLYDIWHWLNDNYWWK